MALGLFLTVCYAGCRKDEPPPPMPAAASDSKPRTELVLELEDSGTVADLADAEAGVKKASSAPASSMQACCDALRQNAASTPPPANAYLLTAAAACSAAVAQGRNKSSIAGIVSQALRGAGMPAACGSTSTSHGQQAPSGRSGGSSV